MISVSLKFGLNIGCGTRRVREENWSGSDALRWYNVDVRDDVGADWVVDLSQPWNFTTPNFYDRVYADNMLEHFDSAGAIHVLNEIGRVLKPFGEALIIVPHALSQGAYQDPTHKSFWVPRSALYWNQRDTPYGGRAVGITANLRRKSVEVVGDMATEAFIRFHVFKEPL